MSEHETLELELRSMRPRAASAELRRRVINQLETSAPLQSQRSWSVALAGALAAACLAAVALWRTGDPHAQSNQNGSTTNVASAADIADLRRRSWHTAMPWSAHQRTLARCSTSTRWSLCLTTRRVMESEHSFVPTINNLPGQENFNATL
jgi:hypothetical protein